MKKKTNPHEWSQPNGESSQPQPSGNPQDPESSEDRQKLKPEPIRKHDRIPEKLLQMVRQAGIDIKGPQVGSKGQGDLRKVKGDRLAEKAKAKERENASGVELPTLPDSIFPTLPGLLQKVVAVAGSKEERDIMLLGSVTSLGACLPKVHGYYDGMKVFPHLYLFITAQASAGKGRLALCKHLVMPVHLLLRQEAQRLKEKYDVDLENYYKMRSKNSNIKKPAKPPGLMLIIPANNSATGMFQLLHENGGCGLIFETEGDTLAQAFKVDHGFSDGFRKGFQHEAITYYRRTEREFAEILCSCIAAVLTGTPNQVASLIPSAENGLLSRFLFYHMNIRPVWKDVFAANGHKKLEEYFDQLGQEFLPLYKALKEHPEIEFCLSKAQQQQFNAFFTQIQEKYLTLQGKDYMATIRRLGLIAFRIAMTLTALRISETGDFSEQQVCSEVDFQTALSMIRVLVKHSSHIFSELEKDTKIARVKNKNERLLDNLPFNFNHQDLMETAENLSIPKRTAELYLSSFCDKGLISRLKKGEYTKLTSSKNDN